MRLDDVLARFDGVKAKGSGGWLARCPAHDDEHHSLSIDPGRDNRTVIKCFAGCGADDIMAAIGLGLADLFDDHGPAPALVAAGPAANGHRAVTTWYDIRDVAGTIVARHKRVDHDDRKTLSWWRPGADRPGLDGIGIADLPLYGSERLATWPADAPIVITEGEKAADSLVAAGIPALGTVTGASSSPRAATLAPLAGRTVILWPDNDEPGRLHLERTGRRLVEAGASCRWFTWTEAPDRGDAADYLARHAAATLRPLLAAAPRWPAHAANGASPAGAPPVIGTGPALLAATFPPLEWVVPEILPEGGALLVGKGKIGKSFLLLGLTIAVACGGRAFGQVPVTRGDVLYLALEDGERRLQRRLRAVLGDAPAPATWHYATSWPTLDDGGLTYLDNWCAAHPHARLIGIDTLKLIRPLADPRQALYNIDYDALAPLTRLGQARRCCVVCVHHSRKAEAEDFLDEASGSTGLGAATETMLVFRRARAAGASEATLHVTGRDLEDVRELALRWDRLTKQWVLVGNAADVAAAREQADALAVTRWLQETLGGGRQWSSDLFAAAKAVGISREAIFAVKESAGIRVAKDGAGRWYWERK